MSILKQVLVVHLTMNVSILIKLCNPESGSTRTRGESACTEAKLYSFDGVQPGHVAEYHYTACLPRDQHRRGMVCYYGNFVSPHHAAFTCKHLHIEPLIHYCWPCIPPAPPPRSHFAMPPITGFGHRRHWRRLSLINQGQESRLVAYQAVKSYFHLSDTITIPS